ncbi:hypothetical protein JCM14076_27400 [Methylosoma difficile]
MNDLKQIISLRIINSDRAAVQAIASRLFVRESDIYRFSINYMINRFHCLFDDACTGSDLLPAMLEIRAEINNTLGLKRNQLEKIINGNNINADKYVAMCDIELLLVPSHLLKQRLSKLDDNFRGHLDADEWLKSYLTEKYKLDENIKNKPFEDIPAAIFDRQLIDP